MGDDEHFDFFAMSDSAKMKLKRDLEDENDALGNQTCKVENYIHFINSLWCLFICVAAASLFIILHLYSNVLVDWNLVCLLCLQ